MWNSWLFLMLFLVLVCCLINLLFPLPRYHFPLSHPSGRIVRTTTVWWQPYCVFCLLVPRKMSEIVSRDVRGGKPEEADAVIGKSNQLCRRFHDEVFATTKNSTQKSCFSHIDRSERRDFLGKVTGWGEHICSKCQSTAGVRPLMSPDLRGE